MLQRSRDTEAGLRLPLPDQAAALAELLERTPKEQWPLLLRAANGADLRVRILDQPAAKSEQQQWNEAPVAELVLRRYMAALRGRDVHVHVDPSSELFAGPMKAFSWLSPGAVQIEVGLQTGDTLAVAAKGGVSFNILGVPPGFWAESWVSPSPQQRSSCCAERRDHCTISSSPSTSSTLRTKVRPSPTRRTVLRKSGR